MREEECERGGVGAVGGRGEAGADERVAEEGLTGQLHLLEVVVVVGEGALQQLEQDEPERVQVGAQVVVCALLHLGRHPERRAGAQRVVRLGQRAFGSAKVGELGDGLRGEEEVERLEVAVHHAARVQVRHRTAALARLLEAQQQGWERRVLVQRIV